MLKEIEDYYKEMGNGQKKRNYYDIFCNFNHKKDSEDLILIII